MYPKVWALNNVLSNEIESKNVNDYVCPLFEFMIQISFFNAQQLIYIYR